ncbi:MAG: hypothetical protein IKC94_03840 [Lentisphaeria bacterium]|nr:hypothetical protein [Lentisphaeria bacterium]
MKRLILLAGAFCAFFRAFGDPMPDAEAGKYLAELAKQSQSYQRRTDRMHIFSRAQLKYGLQRNDFLLRWCDRPLMQDSSFAASGNFTVDNSGNFSSTGFINPRSYQAESLLLRRFHLSGFAFFPETTGRRDIYNHAGREGTGDIMLLPELFFQFSTFDDAQLEARCQAAAEALNNPHTFRIDGKVVITSYPACSERELEVWARFREELQKRHGDKFIIMPWLVLNHGIKPTGANNRWSTADIRRMQERLRTYLRKVDGFYYNTPPFYNRRYQWAFDRTVAIPVIHSVLNEPEFRNKYLAWGVKVGHMNCHHQPFSADAFGTDMLRGSVEAAVLAKADFVNCVEWDEENENTCFRPLTTTGFSTLRFIRAFEQMANNNGYFTMLEGDDPSIPNVVLSYRRVVSAGELLEFEVANIPDSTASDDWQITLALADNDGKIVRTFPAKTLKADRIDAVLFTVPGELLLDHRFLNPVLTVNGRVFDKGFHPLEIRTWWHWDYLWAKHVLRDMPQQTTAEMSLSEPDENGLIAARVKVSSDTPLRSIEIITGDNVVAYSHSDNGEYFRETTESAGFRVSIQGSPKSQYTLDGYVKLINVPGLQVSPRTAYTGTEDHWVFPKRIQNENILHRYFSIPRSALDSAEIEIHLPGMAEHRRIKLAEVMRTGSIAIPGPHSINLVIARNNFQAVMPPPLTGNEYEFTVYLRPDLPEAGFFVQTVDEKFRMFRSRKLSTWKPSGKKQFFHVFSVAENRRRRISADADLLRSLTWDFSGTRGSVVPSNCGSRWDGILGGYVPLVTGFGSGERAYGNAVRGYLTRHIMPDTTAETVNDDGIPALQFDGSQYLALPMAMIPPFAGFKVEMEIFISAKNDKVQALISDSRQGFTLLLNKGAVPTAYVYCNQHAETDGRLAFVNAAGFPLQENQWNKITVISNQQALWVEVNGAPGNPVMAGGYHRYPRATSVGASDIGEFFTGKIRNLSITPY